MRDREKAKELPAIEVSMFCRQAAMILKAGIPLYEGMETLSENYAGTQYEHVFKQIFEGVQSGGTLKDGLTNSGIFPDYMIRMVEMGELTGNLEQVLHDLAVYYEREDQFKASVKNAVTYPIILAVLMAIVVSILVIAVLPVFSEVFASLGSSLSGSTSLALNAGNTIGYVVLIIIAVLLIAVLIIAALWKSGKKKEVLNFFAKAFKPIRKLLSAQTAQRFADVMHMSLDSGYDITGALTLASGMASYGEDAEKIEKLRALTEQTGDFSGSLEKSHIFDALHSKMIRVGAKSGRMDEVMKHMAKIYNNQVEDDLHAITGWIEPVLVAVLTLIIGGILLSVMLPLIGIMASIG